MFVIFECPYLVHNTSFRPTSNLFSIFDKKSLHASLTSIGVINDNKFMKVRLLSRVNSRGSSSLNGNCSSTPGWTYSGGTVPNHVLDLGSHRIPNPEPGIQLLLNGKLYQHFPYCRLKTMCVTLGVVCHTHIPQHAVSLREKEKFCTFDSSWFIQNPKLDLDGFRTHGQP